MLKNIFGVSQNEAFGGVDINCNRGADIVPFSGEHKKVLICGHSNPRCSQGGVSRPLISMILHLEN